jgi:hypothetical protein
VFARLFPGDVCGALKNIDKWQSGKDILVNAQPDIAGSKEDC